MKATSILVMLAASLPLVNACTVATKSGRDQVTKQPQGSLHAQMTDKDLELADSAAQQALERHLSGTTVYWRNPENGHGGDVTPRRTFYLETKEVYCRDYTKTFAIGQESEVSAETACRVEEGEWVPVE